MLNCPACVQLALPKEYKKTADALFPLSGGLGGMEEAMAFAGILGVGPDFSKVLDFEKLRPAGSAPQAEMKRFLHSFQNNLDLLIQKTWVEKTDEDRKDKLQNRLPGFVTLLENADYQAALKEFTGILEELAWLLFGQQSRQNDFLEYAFRIDSQIGLFYWYTAHFPRVLAELKDRDSVRIILLLGLCYLVDF